MRKLLVIFILSFVQTIYSQQNTNHIVGNGETLSSIAQKYRITPYDIIKLNPNAVNGIKEKQVLILPKVVDSSVKASNVAVADKNENNQSEKNQIALNHIVQSKETKYGISKLYGVSIQLLEEQNPQIVLGLQSGQKLKIIGATTNYKQDLSVNTSETFDSKFDYVVLPGETLYGISKRNGLTVDELTKGNTSVLNGVLKSGQKLIIPTRKGFVSNTTSSVVVSSSSRYHLVEPKETKFALSKKYGVTIEQLENLNPQIVSGLQIGQKLKIPESYKGNEEVGTLVVKENKEETPAEKNVEIKVEVKSSNIESTKDYVNYEVQPKETLFSLSKKAGMTISEFSQLNPKLATAVQIGMMVKMPKKSNSSSNVDYKETKGSENAVVTIPKSTSNKYQDLTKTLDKSVKKQLSIVLPFNDAKYKEHLLTSSNFNDVQDEFLKSNLEFYSGALRAIDSAKTLGLNVDVNLSELQNVANDSLVNELAKGLLIEKSNAVVLPFYDAKAQKIAAVLEPQKIPVLVNYISKDEKNTSNLYVALPSESEIRGKVLEYLKINDANVIVVNSMGRKTSKSAIVDKFPNAKFVKVSDRNVVDSDEIKTLLVKNQLNYVILDTDLSSMIISSTNVLLKQSTDFQIQIVVLEPSLLVNYENVSSIRINILKMIYPSYSSLEQTQNILQKSSSNFLLGFDLTFDTLLRMSQNKDFEASTKEDVTECVKYKFQYGKSKEGSSINRGFYILQHDTDNKIKELN
jgi:LysM repeat protein